MKLGVEPLGGASLACMKLYCVVPEKNPYPPDVRSLKIPRGRRVLKVKILEGKYEVKLEFPTGRGVQNKKPSMGSMDILWNCTLSTYLEKTLN